MAPITARFLGHSRTLVLLEAGLTEVHPQKPFTCSPADAEGLEGHDDFEVPAVPRPEDDEPEATADPEPQADAETTADVEPPADPETPAPAAKTTKPRPRKGRSTTTTEG